MQGKKRFLQQLDREKQSQLEWDELCIEKTSSLIEDGAENIIKYYAVKQVVPIVKEESKKLVVVTVYTFYF